ncbi:MAG: hypothetical protein PF638_15880 [Candidatus Delongbacteria bacterium]|jgi:hypothetical protein|nr:hypothetical protein [Candidatus Delongbacteria bacterium]
MKKIYLLFAILVLIFFGCKITGKYQIDQDGKGTGKIIVENFNKRIFISRLNEDEKYSKIEITSIDSISPDIFEVSIKWNKFEDIFQSMKALEDGNIELNLGQSDFPIEVKIDGVVDQKRSTGNLTDTDKMEFKYGKAILTYLPEESFSIVKFLIISAIVLGMYFMFFKKRK